MWSSILIALGLSALIAGLAYRRSMLSRSGVAGAVVVGTALFGLAGWRWGVILVIFFVTSSALSLYKKGLKKEVSEKFDKGHQRDWGQTMANGGMASVFALGSVVFPAFIWPPLLLGALATVTADTWATELGTLARGRPRLITTGRSVPPGTSGGITLQGTGGALAGALLIGLAAGLLLPELSWWQGAVIGGLAGLTGAMVDSLLGATVQIIYRCEVCGKETERIQHHGRPTIPLRGWSWLNNDWVNLLASAAGSGVAVIFWTFFT